MKRRVEVTHPRVQERQETIDVDENFLHRDTEEEQGEGDANESVDHAEQFARRGQWSLLTIANGRDDRAGEEERLTKTPIWNIFGLKGHSSFAVLCHRGDVIIKCCPCKIFFFRHLK